MELYYESTGIGYKTYTWLQIDYNLITLFAAGNSHEVSILFSSILNCFIGSQGWGYKRKSYVAIGLKTRTVEQ